MTNNEDFEPYKMPYAETGLPLSPCMMRAAIHWRRVCFRIVFFAFIFGLISLIQFLLFDLISISFYPINEMVPKFHIIHKVLKTAIVLFMAASIIYIYAIQVRRHSELAEKSLSNSGLVLLLLIIDPNYDGQKPRRAKIGEISLKNFYPMTGETFKSRMEWMSSAIAYKLLGPFPQQIHSTSVTELTVEDIATASECRISFHRYIASIMSVFMISIIVGIILGFVAFMLVMMLLQVRRIVSSLAYNAALIKIFSGYWPWEYK